MNSFIDLIKQHYTNPTSTPPTATGGLDKVAQTYSTIPSPNFTKLPDNKVKVQVPSADYKFNLFANNNLERSLDIKHQVAKILSGKDDGFKTMTTTPATIKPAFGVKDFLKEIPGATGKVVEKVAGTVFPAPTITAKNTFNIFKEALEFSLNKNNAADRFMAGENGVLPTIENLKPVDYFKQVVATELELSLFKLIPPTLKQSIIARYGLGAFGGAGHGLSEGLAKGYSIEETIDKMKQYAKYGGPMAVVAPYIMPILSSELKNVPAATKKAFNDLLDEGRNIKFGLSIEDVSGDDFINLTKVGGGDSGESFARSKDKGVPVIGGDGVDFAEDVAQVQGRFGDNVVGQARIKASEVLDLTTGEGRTAISKTANHPLYKEFLKERLSNPKLTEMQFALDRGFKGVRYLDEQGGKPFVKIASQYVDEAAVKERGLITALKDSPRIMDAVKERLAGNYNPLTNKQTLKEATDLINGSLNDAIDVAENVAIPATAKTNAIRLALIQKYQTEGNIEAAVRLAGIAADHGATTPGQAIQVLSTVNQLGPDGVLMFAQKQVQKANKLLGSDSIKITPEVGQKLVDTAKKIATMPDGYEKAFETAQMLQDINKLFPVSILKKISTYQTIAQLLNPKTFIRNLGGNTAFMALENVNDVAAAAIDSPLSLLTGKRSTSLPSFGTQAEGFTEGLKQGIRESLAGVDTQQLGGQFGLPRTPVFKGVIGKKAETLLNLALKAPDRAFFNAAYEGSIYKQLKALGINNVNDLADEVLDGVKEVAFNDGLYRTFQDDTALSRAFTGLKLGLNKLTTGSGDFGMGDIVLKYPKTPANLLNRGLAYSPAGFAKTVYEGARPLMGKSFNQKNFVESFSRALTGTGGLVGTGALLHRLGIITGKQEKDKDIAEIQKETGLGQYRINLSALKRFALSGMDPEVAKIQEGDKLISYDWLQPMAIGVSIGANIDEGSTGGSLATTIVDSVANGIDTLAEQPLINNFAKVLKYGGVSDAIIKTAQQIPASLVPTILNQIRQLVDDTKRSVYDPSHVSYAFNLAKNKVPVLSQTLQPAVGPFGNDQLLYPSGNNNFFNVFFNPAFSSTYATTPEARMVLSLFDNTDETKQAPRLVDTKQTVTRVKDGKLVTEKITLTPEQVTQLQRFVGTISRAEFHKIANTPGITSAPKEELVNFLSNRITNIGKAAKMVILGDIPKSNPGQEVLNIIASYLGQR